MKLIVISTTIHGEAGYLPFDRLLAKSKFSNAMFVVAGDRNALPFDTSKFQCEVEYLAPEDQERFHVSETIGWNTPRRRPVAWLRALELRPDYILSVDDDNIPEPDYFDKWHEVLTNPVYRIAKAVKDTAGPHWHNYLASSDAEIEIYPRGFPIPFRHKGSTTIQAHESLVAPHQIGLWQGISLGDPDIDAKTRLVYPKRMPLKSIREKNYCLHNVWSPHNTQNTVYAKALFELPVLWPHAGRFDDIFASFVMQKLLFNNGMHTHVGDPVNYQDRGVRDVLNIDLPQEIEGYFNSHKIWEVVNRIETTDPIRFMEDLMRSDHDIVGRHKEFFSAHIKDIGKIT